MEKINKEMIATLVKDGRIAKGYTQKELAEITNISIRSIQRIENATILPRSYTLKTIAQALDLPLTLFTTHLQEVDDNNSIILSTTTIRITKSQKIILSIAIPLVVVLLAIAFISQSSKFPETVFELMLFWCVIAATIATILFFLWRQQK